ncbi:hypothetical protein HYY69_03280 [Candidatus Woesearchaeota archaeon]|nr:hypothetical protein [Candidatus Woesearchaeota archaeon]
MIKIALDTGCLNVKKKDLILNKLDELEGLGKIKLITSTVNEKEQILTNQIETFRNTYLKIINNKEKILEGGRFDISTFDNCVFSDEKIIAELAKIFGKPKIDSNDFFDLWLLETAIIHKCDYFLTKNSNDFIVNGKKEAIEQLGIKVREPNQDFLNELVNSSK